MVPLDERLLVDGASAQSPSEPGVDLVLDGAVTSIIGVDRRPHGPVPGLDVGQASDAMVGGSAVRAQRSRGPGPRGGPLSWSRPIRSRS